MPARDRGSSAEIIIFPGVRYETLANGAAKTTADITPRGTRGKRKKNNG